MIGGMQPPFASYWTLDPDVVFLNHGSFGACPKPVLEAQGELRARLEREPVDFMAREWEGRMDGARTTLARFVGADPDAVAFVTNATMGVNTVLRSLSFAPGDEILILDQGYNACQNAARFVAERSRARVVVVRAPFPLADQGEVTSAILDQVTERTRLALVDHVTSATGLVLPIEAIVRGLDARGVDTLVDGAHAPGMVPLALDALGAAYYTGNCHKWMCTPKGSGFLYVREDRQHLVHPLVISHGANAKRQDRSRFRLEFDFTGTQDPTAWLVIPESVRFMGSLLPGGWDELRERNHALAERGRSLLCDVLGVQAPAPESMLGSLAAVPLPSAGGATDAVPLSVDPIMATLYDRYRIEVLASVWPASPGRILRVSAQIYNEESQYARLAGALKEALAAGA
jgi:isopenicillin-N epimerase